MMMGSLQVDALVELVWWALAKAPLVLAGAGLTAWVLRDASAATRHRVWATAVVATIALPLLSLLVPRVPLSLPAMADDAARSAGVTMSGAGARHATGQEPVVAHAGDAGFVYARPTYGQAAAANAPRGIARTYEDATPAHSGTAAARANAPVMPGLSGDPGPSTAGFALLVWAVVASGLIVRLVLERLRTLWLEHERPDVTGDALGRAVREVAADHGMRDVRVLLGASDAMPVTWGSRRPVLLLPAGAQAWPARRLRAVVHHELAHVRRGDVPLQLLADILCALHWFDPLAWYAAHRMRVEREHACDDEVLAYGTRPSDYASELVGLARRFREVSVAGVAMARRGGLRARVECVLDGQRRRGESRGVRRAIHAGAALMALLLAAFAPAPDSYAAGRAGAFGSAGSSGGPAAAPALAAPSALSPPGRMAPPAVPAPRHAPVQLATLCWSEGEDGSRSVRRNDDRFELDWDSGDCSVDIRVDGELRFSDDFTRIVGISAGGRARFEERDGSRERRVEIRPANGGIERRWWVDGDERPFDDEAQRWLDAMLLNSFRNGALATEERASWMVRTGGLNALLDELPHLRGDWVRGRYMQVALESPDLDDDRATRLVREAASTIGSDHTLMQLLETVATRRSLANAQLRAAFIAAAATMDSDHSRGRSLEAALTGPSLPERDLAAILDAVAGIGSDHTKSELLVAVAERHRPTPELRAAYLRVTASIESDHSTGRAAHALLDAGAPSADELVLALDVARGIESDHTQGELLRRLGAVDLRDDAVRDRYQAALAGIESDHTMGEVLESLMDGAVDEITASVILRAAASIDSDHTLGQVLSGLARRGGVTAATRAAFDAALASIDSRHTRSQVEEALRGR